MPRQDGQQAQHQEAADQDLTYSVEQVARRLKVSARWLGPCRPRKTLGWDTPAELADPEGNEYRSR